MPESGLLFAVLVLVTLTAHFAVLRGLRPRKPIGDEGEYLKRGTWPDPHRPVQYLRVPLFPALFHAAHRACGDSEGCMRIFGALLGSAAVLLVAAAGWQAGSPLAGFVGAGLMLIWIERVLLSAHLWPDTLLCCFHALALYLIQAPPSTGNAIWLGVVVVLATLVRIEQLALGAGLLIVYLAVEPSRWLPWSICILGPVSLGLATWTVVAWHRYRMPFPDTTWLFNLRLLRWQLEEGAKGRVNVEGSIQKILQSDDTKERSLFLISRRLLRHPASLVGSVLQRLAACFGPDTFIRARLLPPMGVGYPSLNPVSARRWSFALRWSFSPLALAGLWGMAVEGLAPVWLLAVIPVLLALVLVHFRSRYRLVLMPWLALGSAQAWLAVAAEPPGLLAWFGLAATLLLSIALIVRPPIIEHESQRDG